MGVIVDANRTGDFTTPVAGTARIILQLLRSRQITLVVGGKQLTEVGRTRFREILLEADRIGLLKRVSNAEVDKEELVVSELPIVSDDPHIVALVRLSGDRVVYTTDANLIKDLRSATLCRPRGKVITNTTPVKSVERLLRVAGA